MICNILRSIPIRLKGDKMRPKIFLDLDGVLADFCQGYIDHLKVPITPDDVNHWGYILNWWKETTGKGVGAFWEQFDEDFWAELKPTKEFQKIIDLVEPHHPIILTAPPITTGPATYHAVRGKVRWIRKYLPYCFYDGRFLVGPCKEACASRFSLLIDDSYDNCIAWKQQGGAAILVPRPWNSAGQAGLNLVKTIEEGMEIFFAVTELDRKLYCDSNYRV